MRARSPAHGWRRLARIGLSLALLTWGVPAHAEPLTGWALSIERLFGKSRVTSRYEREAPIADVVSNYTTTNLLVDQSPHDGYSSPRLAVDYVAPFGLSLGGAFGLHDVIQARGHSLGAVAAPRVGYLFSPLEPLAFWPRLGVTRVWATGPLNDLTAITFELPVVLLFAQRRVGLTLMAYVDVGLPSDAFRVSERGVQLGAAAFFF